MNPAWRFALATGWPVFPLRPWDKIPLSDFKWRDQSSSDPALVLQWALSYPTGNVALDLGKAGLLVLDIDVKVKQGTGYESTMQGYHDIATAFTEANWWPHDDDPQTITASGGWHLWYRQPSGMPLRGRTQNGRAGPLGHHIDVKAHGGYVLLPGCRVKSPVHVLGGDDYYHPVGRWDAIPAAPPWLVAMLRPPAAPLARPSARGMLDSLSAQSGAQGASWRRRIEGLAATQSHRNDALNAVAYGLRGEPVKRGGPSVAELVVALGEACRANGLAGESVEAVRRTIASGLDLDVATVAASW